MSKSDDVLNTDSDSNDSSASVREAIERSFAEKVAASDAQDKAAPPADTASDSPPADKSVSEEKTETPQAEKKETRTPAPVKWTREEKESWEKMTEGMAPEAAAAVERAKQILYARNKSIEAEFTKWAQSTATDRSWKQELDKVLEPRRQEWAARGISDSAAIQQLLAGFDYANRDLPGFINWLCQSRGTSVDQLFGAAQPARAAGNQQRKDSDVELHPEVQRMLDERDGAIQQLNHRLAQFENRYGQVERQVFESERERTEAINASTANEIASFERAVDDHGAPKYPFFADVRADMGRLIGANLAADLQSAYDMAVYSRPDLRNKLLESRDIEMKRQLESKLREDAQRARAAGGGLAPRSTANPAPVAAPPAEGGSLRSIIEAAAREHMRGSSRI